MLELYRSILEDGRAPERYEVMMELTETLYDVGYEDDLDEIVQLVSSNDSVADIVMPVESIVCEATVSLLQRLGITLDISAVYQRPRAALEIVKTLLSDLEAFDDYESIGAILESGDPEVFVLSNVIAFIVGGFDSDYIDIIEYVSPTLMRVIRNVIKAKELSDTSSEDYEVTERSQRAAVFIATYPTAYVTELLDDGGFQDTLDDLIGKIDTSDEEITNVDEMITLTVIGLIFITASNYEESLGMIDKVLELLSPDATLTQQASISRDVSTALASLYITLQDEEVLDESA